MGKDIGKTFSQGLCQAVGIQTKLKLSAALPLPLSGIRPTAMQAVCALVGSGSLTSIDLSFNGINDADISQILEACDTGRLVRLMVGYNKISSYGLCKLLENHCKTTDSAAPSRSSLNGLLALGVGADIKAGVKSQDAILALIGSLDNGALPKLRQLELACNSLISDENVGNLGRALKHRSLQVLDLQRCDVGDLGLTALLDHLALHSMREFAVGKNVTDAGVTTLCNFLDKGCGWNESLELLDLRQNDFSSEGIGAVCKTLMNKRLPSLCVLFLHGLCWQESATLALDRPFPSRCMDHLRAALESGAFDQLTELSINPFSIKTSDSYGVYGPFLMDVDNYSPAHPVPKINEQLKGFEMLAKSKGVGLYAVDTVWT